MLTRLPPALPCPCLFLFCPLSFFLRDGVKEPLGIGDVLLEGGASVKGFIGEAYAVADAPDISQYGGWRAYLAAQQQQAQ